MHSLTEAFQFFDAQTPQALCVHDLLKAFHLRALRPAELALRGQAVQVHGSSAPKQIWSGCLPVFCSRPASAAVGAMPSFLASAMWGVFKGISLDAAASVPLSRTSAQHAG